MSGRAWALISIETERQYGGNAGYSDEPEQVYKYDSHVANHRNVAELDLAILRSRTHVHGIGLIQAISSKAGKKELARCPVCGTTGLKPRRNKLPRFRCNEGHDFELPLLETVDVTQYEARYGETYVATPNVFTVARLKSAAFRPSDQLSIEEVDVTKLDSSFLQAFPETRSILEIFYQGAELEATDASVNVDITAEAPAEFSGSLSDTRITALGAIKLRRGQARFRNSLIRRYSGKCVITGCEILDVLEAAHIWPYRGDTDNSPDNGLLLRADIHTLFDIDQIAIEPTTLKVHLSPNLARSPEYARFQHIRLGILPASRPASQPLQHRWAIFTRKWGGHPNRGP